MCSRPWSRHPQHNSQRGGNQGHAADGRLAEPTHINPYWMLLHDLLTPSTHKLRSIHLLIHLSITTTRYSLNQVLARSIVSHPTVFVAGVRCLKETFGRVKRSIHIWPQPGSAAHALLARGLVRNRYRCRSPASDQSGVFRFVPIRLLPSRIHSLQ
ncbi:hypothetical protein DM02DRAFT_139533 [Periconia macrospinosa]|uniref:Uncharacterized protein n=1 Tax=Periconia macrospinosa TaxID=97972 RepID=A0A2V1DCC1_9PLEO|nr:hypothetical protein DM02DRAFT_139533 [Periconia macrospinosa]